MSLPFWLRVHRGRTPLIVSIPHAGTQLLEIEAQLRSTWLATFDADWYVDRLYAFAIELDATVIATAVSRTVIDVNRDRESRSLYPGLATTELVPTTTFDGVSLYELGCEPSEDEQRRRRERYYDPYHALLGAEIERLRAEYAHIVLYDAHSIRSHVPRLFDGELPLFNIGTYAGRACDARLTASVRDACEAHSTSCVVDGRFKGGAITRTYGAPQRGVHAIQMELACRAYLDEPALPLHEGNWPPRYDVERAAQAQRVLRRVLERCCTFAHEQSASGA